VLSLYFQRDCLAGRHAYPAERQQVSRVAASLRALFNTESLVNQLTKKTAFATYSNSVGIKTKNSYIVVDSLPMHY